METMTKTELIEEIGVLADKADNFLAAAEVLPLPAEVHLEQLKNCLRDISKRLHELSP
jgi:hypothetical protein